MRFVTDTKFNVSVCMCCFFVCCSFCTGTAISVMLRPIGVKFCMTVDISFGQVFSPLGGDIFSCYQMRDQRRVRGSVFGPLKTYLT